MIITMSPTTAAGCMSASRVGTCVSTDIKNMGCARKENNKMRKLENKERIEEDNEKKFLKKIEIILL